jgi:FHS family Na+ dependent glucose MFS transporter 1
MITKKNFLSDRRIWQAAPFYAAFVVLGLSLAAVGPTLPGLAAQTGSTLSRIAAIFTVNSLGYILGALVGGRLFDHLPGRPVMVATLLSIAGLLFVVPVLDSFIGMMSIWLALGVAFGVLDVGGNILILWLFGKEVGPYLNALHFFFGLGAFLSPILIDRMVVITGGFQWAYWLLAALSLPVLLWVASRSTPGRPAVGNGGSDGGTLSYPWLPILVAGLMFLSVGSEITYGGWIFSYALALNLGPETMARVLNSLFWGALTIGRLLAIPVAGWLLPRTILALDLVGMGISVGVILIFPKWPLAIWLGTFGVGFSIASVFATLLTFIERRMKITGRVTGTILVGGNIGAMIVPWLVGQLFVTQGPQALMATIEVNVMLALALLGYMVFYVRRTPVKLIPSTLE